MHSRTSMLGFRSSLLGLVLLVTHHIIHIQAKRSFIVVAPKEFDSGKKETIHVTLLDIKTPGTVSIKLLNSNETILSETTENFDQEGRKKLELYIPANLNTDFNTDYILKVSGEFGDYTFEKNQTIHLRYNKAAELIFLSTDKPFYKAGQTVKFRVLIVNSELKPLEVSPIVSIWITDKNRVRMAQWINVTLENGLDQKEMELPDEPELGSWTLHVQVNNTYRTKSFTIKEYVLPTFEVEITPPSYILLGQKNVTWKICAKYTYGKPVQGKLLTKVKLARYYYSKATPILREEAELDGCKEVTVDVEKYASYRESKYSGLEMFAQVTEHGTGTEVNSTSRPIYPTDQKFQISRDDSIRYFRAGLPFSTKILVKTPDSKPFPDKEIKACAEMKRENWKKNRLVIDNVNFCKIYKTDETGSIALTIPPQPSNTLDINIEAVAPDEKNENGVYPPTLKFNLSPWYSSTGHQLQIQPLKGKAKCGSQTELSVLYTSKEAETKKVYYQIMSKGDIVDDGIATYTFDPSEDLSGYTDETYLPTMSDEVCKDKDVWDNNFPYLSHVGKFSLKLDVDFKMSPKAHLLLYSVTEEGNVLADSTTFEVEPCFENSVEMKFSEEKQFPGAGTTVKVTATPQSICSIGIVDKSVYLIEGGDILTKSKVYDQLRNLDTSEYTRPYQTTPDYEYCSKKSKSDNLTFRQDMEPVGFVDAITAFSKAGVMILSDLELETRPCRPSFSWRGNYRTRACVDYEYQPLSLHGPNIAHKRPATFGGGGYSTTAGFSGVPEAADSLDRGGGGSLSSEPTTTIRVYFPETWLWNVYFVNKEGELFLKEKVPDSITEWQGNAVCLHPDSGLGISDSTSIVAFQPFFTSVKLPYSIVRGETMPIIVTVFNYMKECLPIRIHLDQTDSFELYNGTQTSQECVCGDKSVTTRFFIKPKTLGELNITVTASTIKDEEVCANFDVADISRSDSLTKPLLVEAEGIPKEETKNIFFCMEDVKEGSFKNEQNILLPDDLVLGSQRAYAALTGDIMGPSLEGLEHLVRVPTGCGEQNMVKLVPNIVVLDYLESTGRLTDSIKNKAIKNIAEGYKRQQQYRHNDGSYSAFGKADDSGSMWLTAFVVKTFASASRYVDIDKNALEVSKNWILTRQQDNGCFPVIGMVHNKQLKGGVGKEDKTPAILTAYVLSSLLTSGDVPKENVEKALQCIQAMNNPSDYALAIFAYTASLMESPEANEYLDALFGNMISEGFNNYWKNDDRSISVEIASYATLASLKVKDENQGYLQMIGPVARWLALQRNSYGGFVSTQDTVMALQALAAYATRIKRQNLNMGIAIKGNDFDEIFQLDKGNELLMQRYRLPSLPTGIEIEAKGEGCALVQTVLRYNVHKSEESDHFLMSIQSQRDSSNCNKATITMCVSLSKAQNESNMVVLEMKMVSGYTVVRETVQELVSSPELEIKRFEIKDDKLNLYFTQLTDQSKCFKFDVIQDLVIVDIKPANLKLYDYYSPEKMSTITYSIEEECRISE